MRLPCTSSAWPGEHRKGAPGLGRWLAGLDRAMGGKASTGCPCSSAPTSSAHLACNIRVRHSDQEPKMTHEELLQASLCGG